MEIETGKEIRQYLKRVATKVDNMRLEFKATGHPRKHSMDEILYLIEKVEQLTKGVAKK
jgi:hypothetical protein